MGMNSWYTKSWMIQSEAFKRLFSLAKLMSARHWICILLVLVMLQPLALSLQLADFSTSGNESKAMPNDELETQQNVIDYGLWKRISLGSPADELQIIVQFDSAEAGDLEYELLRELGFKPIHSTKVVPAVLASGPAAAIQSLAAIPEIRWVEWNSPLEYNMNLTKETIHAVEAWDRQTINEYGYASGTQITGAGVTVIVLDSGIDASHPDLDFDGQNPNSPSVPDPDDKVIYNAKLNQGSGSTTPSFLWIPSTDTDSSSGHGTHVAGTVAGNGDASADDKIGIAPDTWLIGLSMGELAFTIDEYSGLEYAYDLSTPGSATQQAWNIRVVTNSWGPGFPFDSYDPNDLTVQIIEKLSHDNNVVVTFANGNDGGDGSDDRSNIFAKVPVSIGVAAANRDGVGMSSFSSRGDMNDMDTWPDIAAPGVDIWSAAARATLIGGATGAGDAGSGDLDYYYLAISGTSMATPHVAGLVALMWQAAPLMGMSEVDEDLDSVGNPILHDPTGLADPQEAQRPIHEAEVILKLTADYMQQGENLADNFSIGLADRPLDYTQGYGMVNADKAVALALTLQRLRDSNSDGIADNDDVTVFDAYNIFEETMNIGVETFQGSGMLTTWEGDFAVFASENDLPPASAHRREFFVPEGTTFLVADLDYNGISASVLCPTSSVLRLALDADGDGSYEEADIDEEELTFDGGTEEGAWWAVDVQGAAIGSCWTGGDVGPRAEYTVEIEIRLLPDKFYLNVNESRGWEVYGAGPAQVTMDRLWYTHPKAENGGGELTGLSGMLVWLQDNWWIPTLLTLTLIVGSIAMNERTQDFVSSLRERVAASREHEDILDATYVEVVEEIEVLDAEILDAELL